MRNNQESPLPYRFVVTQIYKKGQGRNNIEGPTDKRPVRETDI